LCENISVGFFFEKQFNQNDVKGIVAQKKFNSESFLHERSFSKYWRHQQQNDSIMMVALHILSKKKIAKMAPR